jgi:hypothetical protein
MADRAWRPTPEDLDTAVTDRPAFLPNRDGHSAGQHAAGLAGSTGTRRTTGGRIRRDPDAIQWPLHEAAAEIVERLLPPTTDATRDAGLQTGQGILHSLGVTAWQDAIVEAAGDATYRRAAAAGWLTGRVEGALWWDRECGLEQVDELIERSGAWPRRPVPPEQREADDRRRPPSLHRRDAGPVSRADEAARHPTRISPSIGGAGPGHRRGPGFSPLPRDRRPGGPSIGRSPRRERRTVHRTRDRTSPTSR